MVDLDVQQRPGHPWALRGGESAGDVASGPFTCTSGFLGVSHLLAGFFRVSAAQAVMTRMRRRGHLLEVLDPVIRLDVVDVVDDVAGPDRISRVMCIPCVVVPLDVAVSPDRRMQVALILWDEHEYALLATVHPGAALPQGMVFAASSSLFDLCLHVRSHSSWRAIGARPRAVLGRGGCRVETSEGGPAHRAISSCSHDSELTTTAMRGWSRSAGPVR